MPAADEILTVEPAVAQRPARMIADGRNGAEDAVLEGQGNLGIARHDTLQGLGLQFRCWAEIDPILCTHADPHILVEESLHRAAPRMR